MDSDFSGFIDFKEYKITRFLIDGVANINLLKKEFCELDNTGRGKVYYKNFVSLFKK